MGTGLTLSPALKNKKVSHLRLSEKTSYPQSFKLAVASIMSPVANIDVYKSFARYVGHASLKRLP